MEGLPFAGLVLIVLAGTFLGTAAVYAAVMALATGRRAEAFRAVSPGMLPPMGLLFALLIGFLAAQVWSDASRAQDAVNREASALRSTVLLAHVFPDDTESRMSSLVRRHIQEAIDKEWPAMAQQEATLTLVPVALADALQLAIGITPGNQTQQLAQGEIVDSLEAALDARRQRILVSESSVTWVKWTGMILVALLTLVAIAFVHCGNRLTAALALGIFAGAVAVSLILIAAHERPFSGQFAVSPDALVEVMPPG